MHCLFQNLFYFPFVFFSRSFYLRVSLTVTLYVTNVGGCASVQYGTETSGYTVVIHTGVHLKVQKVLWWPIYLLREAKL